jgi:WD40 repeat protein
MALLFISHSSADAEIAQSFAARLGQRGYQGLFLDFDPERGIPPGRKWEEELYSQLRRADALVFLASPQSVGSIWCAVEVGLARSAGKPVFPVTVSETARLKLLADAQWLDLTRDGDAVFDRLIAGLSQAGVDPSNSFAWDVRRSPYPGLLAFAPEDAAVFFGREREIDRVMSMLHPTVEREPGRFVAVIGPSGSGKSSLVNAGVLPRLARLGKEWTVLPRMVPGTRPIANLARSLRAAFEAAGENRSHAEVTEILDRGPDGLVSLVHGLSDLTECQTVLLVLDQSEELITRAGTDERKAFFELLNGSLHAKSPLWVLATMRSEFLSGTSGDHKLAELIDDPVVIEPLSRPRLPEVIERPAQRGGIQFDPGLVQRMIEDTVGGDALPLLAFTLFQLYEHSPRIGPVTAADYDAVGGVIGALRGRADLVLEELTRDHDHDLVLATLMKLATIERGREPTGRRVRRETLNDAENQIMDAFVAARLLKGEGDGPDATVEVAHEALLRQWAPLHDLLESSRQSIEMRAEMERAAQDWERAARDDAYLLRGTRLLAAAEWVDDPASDVGTTELELVTTSREYADRELAQARRAAGRLRALVGGLAVLLVVGVGLLIYALHSKSKADSATETAQSRLLAGQAERAQDLQYASLFALEAYRTSPTEDAQSAILQIAGSHELGAPFATNEGGINRVAWSPDGKLLVTAGADGRLGVWTAATHRKVTQIDPPPEAIALHQLGVAHLGLLGTDIGAVAFGNKHEWLAYAVNMGFYSAPAGEPTDRTLIKLWSPINRRMVTTVTGPAARVNSLAFSPEGTELAAGATDGTVRVWSLAGAHRELTIKDTGSVNSVAFSPDGQTIASSSCDQSDSDEHGDTGDHVVLLSNARTGRTVARLHERYPICSIAFSPNGQTLAAASDQDIITVWNLADRQPVGIPLAGHTDVLNSVAFSPDGTMLASASRDHTVRLWSVADDREIGAPMVTNGEVNSVTFSPDGHDVVSGGSNGAQTLSVAGPYSDGVLPTGGSLALDVAFSPDGHTLAWADSTKVHLWNVQSREPIATISSPIASVNSLAFGRGGQILAWVDNDDHRVWIWNVAADRLLARFPAPESNTEIRRIAISPNGKLLAFDDTKGIEATTIRLWDIATRSYRAPIQVGNTGELGALAFNPDSTILASSGLGDGTVRLWNVSTERELGRPIKAEASGGAIGLAFSPDGTTVASGGGDGAIRFWDVATHQERGAPLTDDPSAAYSLAFSRDGTTLVSAGLDGTVRLWNVATDESELTFTGHTSDAFGVVFNPAGSMVASAGGDGTVRLWSNFSVAPDISRLCGYVKPQQAARTWAQLEPSIPFRPPCPR